MLKRYCLSLPASLPPPRRQAAAWTKRAGSSSRSGCVKLGRSQGGRPILAFRIARRCPHQGATVREVGQTEMDAHARAMRPTMVLGVTDDMKIREVIFSPILPVFTIALSKTSLLCRIHVPIRSRSINSDTTRRRSGPLGGTMSGNVTINGASCTSRRPFCQSAASAQVGSVRLRRHRRFPQTTPYQRQARKGHWNSTTLLRAPFGKMAERILAVGLR